MKTLSRRQLVKQRKLDRLIEKSNLLDINFSFDFKNICSFFIDKKNILGSDYLGKIFNEDIYTNIRYKDEKIKTFFNFVDFIRVNKILSKKSILVHEWDYTITGLTHKNVMMGCGSKKEDIYFIQENGLERFFVNKKCDSAINNIRIHKDILEIFCFQKKGVKRNEKYKSINFLIHRSIFETKLINALKKFYKNIRDKVNYLVEQGICDEDFANKKYLIFCNFFYSMIYGGYKIFNKDILKKLKNKNELFKSTMDVISNYYPNYMKGEHIYIYRQSYINNGAFDVYKKKRKVIPKGYSVSNGKKVNTVLLDITKNYLKDIFDLSKYKNIYGKLKQEYHSDLTQNFIKSINKGIL